jgi:hypothetical protein
LLPPVCRVLQVKDCVGEQVQQLVPSLVNNGIAAHVPTMIEEVSTPASCSDMAQQLAGSHLCRLLSVPAVAW